MADVEKYSSEIPKEIKLAINAIDNDVRQAIVVALLKHDELSFTELLDKLKIEKGSLSNHLKKLRNGALVEHYFKHEFDEDKYSYYDVTSFGECFVDALFKSLEPPLPTLYLESELMSELIIDVPIQYDNIKTWDYEKNPIGSLGCNSSSEIKTDEIKYLDKNVASVV